MSRPPHPSPRPRGGREQPSPSPRGRGQGEGAGARRPKTALSPASPDLLTRARALRRDMTPAERRLWRALREAELGVRVRRQVPLGPFIADFYVPAAKLVIEVDGATHDDPAADSRRDAWLAARGVQVLRVTNTDVVRDIEGVMTAIVRLIVSRVAPPPRPSPARGEGEGCAA